MIKINLHGILGHEFGKEFKINAKSAFFALKALDCIKKGFLNKIKNLQKNGLTYSVIVDSEWIYDKNNFFCLNNIQQIDLVPNICGAIDWGQALLTGFLVGAAFFTGGATLPAAIGVGVLAAGLNMLTQVMNKPKGDSAKLNTQFVGGQSAASSAQSQSYAFTNTDNVAAQNTPIPIGYGRMRVGTKIIQSSIKSYPTSKSVYSEFSENSLLNKISIGFIS